jgi:4-hydroxy-3-methylbut-2-enyl diphosphate reductase
MVKSGAEVILIIGSSSSSNSVRMKEVAEHYGAKAHLLPGVGDLSDEWLNGVGCIGISSGASTPDHLVEELIKALIDRHGAVVTPVVVADEDHIVFTQPKELR